MSKKHPVLPFCHHCRGYVKPARFRCPECHHLLWELMAKVPDKNSAPTRTTTDMYRRLFEATENDNNA
jgi:hypothetical protein